MDANPAYYCGNAELVDHVCILATLPDCMLLNCDLAGLVTENANPGWYTHNADLLVADHVAMKILLPTEASTTQEVLMELDRRMCEQWPRLGRM